MKHLNKLLILALASATSLTAQAAGNAAAGKAIAGEKCQACHGMDGNNANAQFPRLAGQYADYLEHTLNTYKSGARSNPIMAGQAAGLSEQDIKDVSAWYASQTGLITPEQAATVSR